MEPLHVTNGDHAAEALRTAGIAGEIITWRDVLHEGPVPDSSWDEVRRVRARHIAARGWASEDAVLAAFGARDETLLGALEARRAVTLWFEHDLYDQLQLLQVLAMCAHATVGKAPVAIVQSDDYLGTMPADDLRDLGHRAVDLTPDVAETAGAAWRAFTSPSLDALPAYVRALEEDLDDSPLRHVHPALQRLLEERPNEVTGLARTELQVLRALAQAPMTRERIYHAAHHEVEPAIWLGDTSFYAILGELAAGGRPLIRPAGAWYSITREGREVLAGRARRGDFLALDRWIGGVHFTT